MQFRLVPVVLAALLAGACSDATAPEPVKEEWVVGPSMMVNGASGRFATSCTVGASGKRCTLLWIGASATSVVALATCIGSLSIACAGGALAAAYTWDQWRQTPDCAGCANPWSFDNKAGNWYRHDYMNSPTPEPKPGDDGFVP